MKPRRVFVFGCVNSLRFVGYILAYTSQKCHADVTWLKAMTLPRAYRFGTTPHLCTVGFLKLRWREGVQPSALALLLLPSVSLLFLFSVYQVAKAPIKRSVPPDHPPPDWGSKKTKDSRNILPTSIASCSSLQESRTDAALERGISRPGRRARTSTWQDMLPVLQNAFFASEAHIKECLRIAGDMMKCRATECQTALPNRPCVRVC